ncbi:hypothetical protein ACKKBG_A27620 [Auxenochlorella protothecoides x Auxenochlorella symbiontica]
MVLTALEPPCRPCGRPFISSPVPRSLPRPCTRVNTSTSRIKAYELNERGARMAVRGMQVHAAESGASAVATQDTATRVTDDVEVVLQATASAPGGCELRIQSQLRGSEASPMAAFLMVAHHYEERARSLDIITSALLQKRPKILPRAVVRELAMAERAGTLAHPAMSLLGYASLRRLARPLLPELVEVLDEERAAVQTNKAPTVGDGSRGPGPATTGTRPRPLLSLQEQWEDRLRSALLAWYARKAPPKEAATDAVLMRFSSSQARGPAAEALPRLQLSLTARATGIVPRQVSHPASLSMLGHLVAAARKLERCAEPDLLPAMSRMALDGTLGMLRPPDAFELGVPTGDDAGATLAVPGSGRELELLRAALSALLCGDFGRRPGREAWFPRDARLRVRAVGPGCELEVGPGDTGAEPLRVALDAPRMWELVDCIDALAALFPAAFAELAPLPLTAASPVQGGLDSVVSRWLHWWRG